MASLYLSPNPPTMTLIPESLCRDAEYMKMRLARLDGDERPRPSDLKKLCADLRPCGKRFARTR